MRIGVFILLLMLPGLPALACEKMLSLADADWRMQRGDDPAWAAPGFDDRDWTRLGGDGARPADGLGPRDGFVWYRAHFQVEPEALLEPCHVLLGRIQETDEVYLNGRRIGGEGRLGSHWFEFVSARHLPRSYEVPDGALATGGNLLAVRVFSLYLDAELPVVATQLGPTAAVLHEHYRMRRATERIESVVILLLALGGIITGFLSLTRRSERQHLMLFGLIIAVGTIYLVDSMLLYPLRMEAAWSKRLVLLAGPLIPLVTLRYLSAVSGQKASRVMWALAGLPALAALPLLFNQPLLRVVRLYDLWFLSYTPFVVIVILFTMRRARYRVRQSGLLFTAGVVISIALLLALVGGAAVPGTLNPIEIGILGMTAILIMAFIRRLKREYEARLRLSAGVLATQDEERRRIARELHDGLGQRLVAARLLLEAEALKQPGSALQEVVRELRDTTRELRAIVHGLRPVELGEVSLRSALQSYSQRMHELTGVHVQVIYNHRSYLPSQVEEHLFRIFQEAVNNAIRHGGATEIRIELSGAGPQLEVRISDDGAGFKIDEANRGLGLTAIAERARLCNGELNIESKPGEGTTLSIEIPLS